MSVVGHGIVATVLRNCTKALFGCSRSVTVRVNPLTAGQWGVVLGGKLTFLCYRFIIPGLFMPWGTLLLMNIVADYAGGLWIGLITHLNHVLSEASGPGSTTPVQYISGLTFLVFPTQVDFPKADENNTIHADWYRQSACEGVTRIYSKPLL